jgi:hypothetical protein
VIPKPLAPVPFVLALVATLGADVVLAQIDSLVRSLIPPGPFIRQLESLLGGESLPLVLASVVLVGPSHGSSRGRGRSSRRSRATC